MRAADDPASGERRWRTAWIRLAGETTTNAQRILLVRSDDTHRALHRRLVARGYDVFEAEDEREGVRMAWELEPDLVVGEEAVRAGDRARALDDVVIAIETLIDAPPAPRG